MVAHHYRISEKRVLARAGLLQLKHQRPPLADRINNITTSAMYLTAATTSE